MLVSQIIVTLAEYVHISAFHYHFSILSFSIFLYSNLTGERG